MLAKPYRDADLGFEYTIFTRDGALIGHIDAVREENSKSTIEIGFWLGTPYCGLGYAAEALRAVTDGAIAAGFSRVFLCIDVENARCRRVAEKCGYRMEKFVRQTDRSPTGEPRDRCIYAVGAV
jgi:RimJ/RimL family protein N-acetyltransferase